jgi:hypothetical protein
MAGAVLNIADWISATEAGEYRTQANNGAWILAPGDIRDALLGGCDAVLILEDGYVQPPPEFWFLADRLRWVNALNPSMRREDSPDRRWPWELRAYILSNTQELLHVGKLPFALQTSALRVFIEGLPPDRQQAIALPVFLHRAQAVQWDLCSALESSHAPSGQLDERFTSKAAAPTRGTLEASSEAQAASEPVTSTEALAPKKQPPAPATSMPSGTKMETAAIMPAAPAPVQGAQAESGALPSAAPPAAVTATASAESPAALPTESNEAATETTRWQREPVIAVIKRFYPPDGVRPKGVSIKALTDRINREPEFRDKQVSEDTVDRADKEIRAVLKK